MGNELNQEREDTLAQFSLTLNCAESIVANQQKSQMPYGKKRASRKRSEIEKHDKQVDSMEMIERLVGFELKLKNRPRRLIPRLNDAKISLEIAWNQWLEGLRLNDILLDVTHLAERMLDAAGLQDWSFQFEDSKKRVGCCDEKLMVIMLDRSFVWLNFLKDKQNIRETLLHEIAHAIRSEEPRRFNHDAMWREIAISIGSNGERYLYVD